ncbi:MAG: Bifunctional protein FolD [Parcubacteria group bacterium GW2011_GWF2_39_13b]|nr:MAG: Bifunctional protein FolD [Parcubacteria group bacterium GW2011_GWF2_39_13b]
MRLFNGKKFADKILGEIKENIEKEGLKAKLAVFLIGEDEASKIYIRLKKEATIKVGIEFELYKYDREAIEQEISEKIIALNKDKNISGIIAQLPLPERLNRDKILSAISPLKDVDGFHQENRRLFEIGEPRFKPILPSAILLAIKEAYRVSVPVFSSVISAQAGIQNKKMLIQERILDPRFPSVVKIFGRAQRGDDKLRGKKAVALVNSDIFGQMLKLVLEKEGINFQYKLKKTCLISGTDDDLKKADIIITACGCPGLVRGEMIKPGAILIDAGIFRAKDGKVVGDIDRKSVENIASFLTPVPGGIGPLVIALLLQNVCLAAKK